MSKSSVGHPRSASYNSTEDEVDIDEEPVDTGLIRCICSSSEDDGFTIQCERCLVWQHAFCVRISQNNIPEHYLCDQCERKFANPSTPWRDQFEQFSKAVENDVRSVLDKKLRQRPDFRDNGIDKQHFRDIYNRIGDDDDYKPGVANRRQFNGHKKNPVGRPPKRPKLSKKIAVSKRSLQELELQGERRKRVQEDEPAFQRISYNLVRSKHARQVFKDARDRWHRLEKGKEKAVANGTTPARESAQHIVTDDCLVEKGSKRATVRPLSKRWQYLSSERQGLFADSDIEKNQFVAQVNGDILLKSEYKFDPANDFVVLGTPCAHVFFYPTLDLCIDARCRGNDVRIVRRSCHPNTELRGIIAPHAQGQEIRLGLFARKDIKQDDELTIGWNWQRGHISWKKNLEWHDCGTTDGHQVIDEEEERGHRAALSQMLNRFSKEFGDCACDDINLCFIEHLKAIMSGSDESPLTSFKSSKQDINGTVSRAEGDHVRASSKERSTQPSRQTIVSGIDSQEKTGQPSETGEDSIVIDVVSTSPLVRSPVISTPARASDTEEELDIDGDIDVGDETMDYVPTVPQRQSSSERSLSRTSSISSFSGTEGEARNGKRTRRLKKASDEKPSKRQSIGPQSDSDMPAPAKLPCKKAWMRNFMQQVTPAPIVADDPMDISKDEPEISSENQQEVPVADQADTKSESENVVKEEEKKKPGITENKSSPSPPISASSPLPQAPSPPKIEQRVITTTAGTDIEDDGELSDASSASTIPIIEQDDDRLNGLTVEEDQSEEAVGQQEQQADDTEALSSETDEQLKPTKVKLSLQEYLARRGTSGQSNIKVANGDKSQDCSASSEEHSWMTATNQVEVTMEVRQREAQH